MSHFIISLILKAIELIFGGDLKKYLDNNSDKVWYTFLGIIILIGLIIVVIFIYGIIKDMYKEKNKYSNDIRSIIGSTVKNNIKDPFSHPNFRGEKASGSCPKCGYPIVVAKRSYKTGELYFCCASTNKDNMRSCNFNGCRSY